MGEFNTTLVAGNLKRTMQAAGASSRDLWYVPYNQLRIVKGFNVRVKDAAYVAHIRSIADSVKANGFYPDKPLAGYVATMDGEEVIVITDGHCRFDACGLAIAEGAPLEKIPVVVKPSSTSMADLTVALVVSNSGKPLTPYETAMVCKRLESFGWTPEEMANKLSFSRTYVDQLLSLLALPEAVQTHVRAGTVSAANALAITKRHGEKAAEVIEKAAATVPEKGRVTQKHIEPSDKFAKALRRESRAMYDLLQSIADDPAYLMLGKDLRDRFLNLVDVLPKEV